MTFLEEKKNGAIPLAVQERRPNGESSSNNILYRNMPGRSFACERENMRVEEGSGSLPVQFWKSFNENIHLYDLASGEGVSENKTQHNQISGISCESRGVL